MIKKISQQIRNRMDFYFYSYKGHKKNPTAKILLDGDRLNAFHMGLGKKKG